MANGKPLYVRTPTGIIRYDNNFDDEQVHKINDLAILGIRGEAEDPASILSEDNYHHKYFTITKQCIGLERCDNTPDTEKDVATARTLKTGRELKIGLTSKIFDGSKNLSWDIASEIGALPLTGGVMTGRIINSTISSGGIGLDYSATTNLGSTGIRLSGFGYGLDLSYGTKSYGIKLITTEGQNYGISISSSSSENRNIVINMTNTTGTSNGIIITSSCSSNTLISLSGDAQTGILIGSTTDITGSGISSYKQIRINSNNSHGGLVLNADNSLPNSIMSIQSSYMALKESYSDKAEKWVLNASEFRILDSNFIIDYKSFQQSNPTGTVIANTYVKSSFFDGPARGVRDYNNSSNEVQVGFSGASVATSEAGYVAVYKTGDSATKQIKDMAKADFVKWIADTMYPVGSIFINTDGSNPGDKFGGTWELYSKGRTLVGIDTNDTNFNTADKTGGRKDSVLPAHTHTQQGTFTSGDNSVGHTHEQQGTFTSGNNSVGHTHSWSGTTSNNSVGHTHTWSGTTGNNSVGHTHTQSGTFTSTSVSADHSHYFSGTFNTGTVSSDHTHSFGAWSGGISANHTHGAFNAGWWMPQYSSPEVETIDSNGKLADGDGGGRIIFSNAGQGSAAVHTSTGTVSSDHTHYTSGTTSGISANHYHGVTVAGNTGGISANHTHNTTISGNTGSNSANHTHDVSGTTGGVSANHTHDVSGTTGGVSANHTHNTTISGNTKGVSANHTHNTTISGNVTSTGVTLTGNENLQPYVVVYIWKRTK